MVQTQLDQNSARAGRTQHLRFNRESYAGAAFLAVAAYETDSLGSAKRDRPHSLASSILDWLGRCFGLDLSGRSLRALRTQAGLQLPQRQRGRTGAFQVAGSLQDGTPSALSWIYYRV